MVTTFNGSENGKVPRILIAGTHSSAGKSTVATGIMAALRKRGLRVHFINPVFHQTATGIPSRAEGSREVLRPSALPFLPWLRRKVRRRLCSEAVNTQ